MIKVKDRIHYFLAKIAGKEPDTVLSPRTKTEYWLNEIANTVKEKSLPAVTSVDNGKVLTVVNGIWEATSN